MSKRITILGGGPGGYVAAVRAAQSGADVTLVEKDALGGTCLNRGCIPSKIFQTTAGLLHQFKRGQEFGIQTAGPPVLDMAALLVRKQKIVNTQVKGIENLLKHNGVTLLKGKGTIETIGSMNVLTAEGNTQRLDWDALIISTGSEPLEIPAFPFDGQKVISSTDALNLDELPESMVIVGGGVIGCEFACIMTDLGARVTVVEALDRLLPLPSVDAGCSKVLQREMKKKKIGFLLDKTVTRVDAKQGKALVSIGPSPFKEDTAGKDQPPMQIEADKVLVAIGRQSNAHGIGIENLGLALDKKGWITADNHLKTSAENVFAPPP